MIASSANITDTQFLAGGIYSAQSGGAYLPSFTGAGGKIVVEQGALITTNTPASVTSGGGFVLLMGTEVDNAGSITTPKGRPSLLRAMPLSCAKATAPTPINTPPPAATEIAPLFAAGSTSGTVTNTGLILAQQGDITLAGHAVTQDGILLSTTSVNQRGTIHLLNSASDATGSVTLTGNGISLILPELDSTDAALNSQRDALIAASGANGLATGQFDNLSTLADRKDQSRIEIVTGGLVDFGNGSLTMARAARWRPSPASACSPKTAPSSTSPARSAPCCRCPPMRSRSTSRATSCVTSPQNRDSGVLINSNIWIDARDLTLVPAGTGGYASDRYYTAGGLLEVSGYLNNTGHKIGEWTAVGGSITLSAPEVVAQQGIHPSTSPGLGSVPGRLCSAVLPAWQRRPHLQRQQCSGQPDLYGSREWLRGQPRALGYCRGLSRSVRQGQRALGGRLYLGAGCRPAQPVDTPPRSSRARSSPTSIDGEQQVAARPVGVIRWLQADAKRRCRSPARWRSGSTWASA